MDVDDHVAGCGETFGSVEVDERTAVDLLFVECVFCGGVAEEDDEGEVVIFLSWS